MPRIRGRPPPQRREAGLSACRRKGAGGGAPPVPERFFASAAFRDGRRCRSARSASAARTAGACGAPVSARKKGPTVQPFRPADPAAQYSSEGGDCRTGSAVTRKRGARRRNGRPAYGMRRAMPRRLRRCGRWRSPIRENRNLGFRFLHERRPGFERRRGAPPWASARRVPPPENARPPPRGGPLHPGGGGGGRKKRPRAGGRPPRRPAPRASNEAGAPFMRVQRAATPPENRRSPAAGTPPATRCRSASW